MTEEGWSITDSVLAGAAAHNAGEYAVARAIWAGEAPVDPDATDADGAETHATSCETGPDGGDPDVDNGEPDADRLLDGLSAFATAVTESRRGEWVDALDAAAESELSLPAVEDADSVDDCDVSVDTGPIERWLARFQVDPEMAERSPPPTVAVVGDRPTPEELPLSAAAVVASTVAAARGDDPAVVADAVRFAHQDDRPESTRYATFLRDYAGADPSQRPIVFERLSGVVARERRKEDDVDGLFES